MNNHFGPGIINICPIIITITIINKSVYWKTNLLPILLLL